MEPSSCNCKVFWNVSGVGACNGSSLLVSWQVENTSATNLRERWSDRGWTMRKRLASSRMCAKVVEDMSHKGSVEGTSPNFHGEQLHGERVFGD